MDKEEWIRLLAERAAAKRVGLLPETVGPLEPEREELVERVRESFEQTQPDPGSGKTTIIHVRLPAEQKQTLETAAKAAELTLSELVRRSATSTARAILAEYQEES